MTSQLCGQHFGSTLLASVDQRMHSSCCVVFVNLLHQNNQGLLLHSFFAQNLKGLGGIEPSESTNAAMALSFSARNSSRSCAMRLLMYQNYEARQELARGISKTKRGGTSSHA